MHLIQGEKENPGKAGALVCGVLGLPFFYKEQQNTAAGYLPDFEH